jgi:hypothetical protein
VLQGVRARIFPKELEDFSNQVFEEKIRRFITLKYSKGRRRKVTCRQISSSGGISCLLRKNNQGEIGWSEFSKENS